MSESQVLEQLWNHGHVHKECSREEGLDRETVSWASGSMVFEGKSHINPK